MEQEGRRISILFFCGHESPYGLAHLDPLIHSRFELISVVMATQERWSIFRHLLSGEKHMPTDIRPGPLQWTKRFVRWGVRSMVRGFRGSDPLRKKVEKHLRKANVPYWNIFDVNENQFLNEVKSLNPELIVSAAYPQIFSKDLVLIPEKGCVNFHPSLLPKYRGAHPHFWTIVKGEKTSGVSAHFMTERIDEGPVIAQREFPIDHYNYHQLYEKLLEETPPLVAMVERFFYEKGSKATPQNVNEATYFKNDREIHRRIFWSLHTADQIKNLIRSEKAFCFFRGRKVTCFCAQVSATNRNLTNDVQVEDGTIVDLDPGGVVVVKARNGCVTIGEIEERGKRVRAGAWFTKHKVQIGEKFD